MEEAGDLRIGVSGAFHHLLHVVLAFANSRHDVLNVQLQDPSVVVQLLRLLHRVKIISDLRVIKSRAHETEGINLVLAIDDLVKTIHILNLDLEGHLSKAAEHLLSLSKIEVQHLVDDD